MDRGMGGVNRRRSVAFWTLNRCGLGIADIVQARSSVFRDEVSILCLTKGIWHLSERMFRVDDGAER